MKRGATPLLGLMLAVAAACSGTETGNPPKVVQLAFGGRVTDPSVASFAADMGSSLHIEELWLALAHVRGGSCDDAGAELDLLDGPTAVDLTAEATTISIVQQQDYCSVVVNLAAFPEGADGDAPSRLDNSTVYLRGVTADGTSLELLSTMPLTAHLAPQPMEPGSIASASGLFLAFDVSTWLLGVHIDQAVPDMQGVISIDHANNPELLTAFESAFGRGVTLHDDADASGTLDPDEEAPIAHHSQ